MYTRLKPKKKNMFGSNSSSSSDCCNWPPLFVEGEFGSESKDRKRLRL